MGGAHRPAGFGGTLLAMLGLAATAVAIRLPLLGLPLNPDEGGYALIARRWAAGASLYGDAWVDRPPGLLLDFRVLTAISDSPAGVRLGTLLAGAAISCAGAAAAWALAGRRAGLVAGLIIALVSGGAFVEGFAFNGELAAAVPGSSAVALALWWRRGALVDGWLLLAGMLAAAAAVTKQSALDAVVLVLAVALVGRPGPTPSRGTRRWPGAALAGAGVAVVGTALLGQAVLTGWPQWWYAVVGFQAGIGGQVGLAERVARSAGTAMAVSPDLLGLALVAGWGVVQVWRRPRDRWPALLWPAVALLAVLAGPFAHPHYWIQAIVPLAVLAGAGLSWTDPDPSSASDPGPASVPDPSPASAPDPDRSSGSAFPAPARSTRRLLAGVAVAVAVPVLAQAFLAVQPPARRATLAVHSAQRLADPTIAGWLRAHAARTDQVYAFVAAADLYLLSGLRCDFPYLWRAAIESVPEAVPRLRNWLAGADAPRWVVVYQQPAMVDPSGVLGLVLATRYRQAAVVAGYPILELTGP